ncbi:MAG: hypothetical protein XD94_1275 [Mesotoga prima]|uniref:Uncharacterized protein n=2 Tax=Mesotoga TaxID=1184396 RepID=A0A124FY31_9BACT|nr:MAG: hypothetical protein XD94_1275 [Mesotoga prima]
MSKSRTIRAGARFVLQPERPVKLRMVSLWLPVHRFFHALGKSLISSTVSGLRFLHMNRINVWRLFIIDRKSIGVNPLHTTQLLNGFSFFSDKLGVGQEEEVLHMLERTDGVSGIEGITYQTLSGLSYWAGFVGIWTIVGAVLGIIGSIVGMVANPFSIFGAISAVVALIMGLKLRSSKKELDSFVQSKASINLEIALDSLRHYFRIQGILIILALVFIVITIVSMAAMGSLMANYMNSF